MDCLTRRRVEPRCLHCGCMMVEDKIRIVPWQGIIIKFCTLSCQAAFWVSWAAAIREHNPTLRANGAVDGAVRKIIT